MPEMVPLSREPRSGYDSAIRMLGDAATRALTEAAALEAWLMEFRARAGAFTAKARAQLPPDPRDGLAAAGITPRFALGSPTLTSTEPPRPSDRTERSVTYATFPEPGAVLALPHPEWLYHRLSVWGPPRHVQEFARAAAGAGVTPWQCDYQRLEEDWAYLILASLARRRAQEASAIHMRGVRALARRLRRRMEMEHEAALSWIGISRACPFDLHQLVPVPAEVLALGSDDRMARAWLWQNWGTTWPLRRVERQVIPTGKHQPQWCVSFWSADWSPWRAIAWLQRDWPELTFQLAPHYDNNGRAELAAWLQRQEAKRLVPLAPPLSAKLAAEQRPAHPSRQSQDALAA